MVGLLRRRRLRRNAERPVIGFAARLKWRVVVVLLQDLISARADISDCFNLLCPKAVRRLLRSLAQKLLGIEGAASGIIQDAIDDTIKSIAISVDGVAEQRIFISKNGAGRAVEHLPHHPRIAANVMVRLVGNGITSDDPVVIVREALRLHQRLSPARGAAIEVRMLRLAS